MRTSLGVPEADEEISALIETLHATEHRLETLTHGEIDTVANRTGWLVMLRRAQERMRQSESAKQASILNALPANIALLDVRGNIVSVNEGWRRFADANLMHGPAYGIGLNYLEICDSALGSNAAESAGVAAGIRAVLAGETKSFSIEYPCHAPAEQRWFVMTVSPMAEQSAKGAVVMHVDTTDRVLSRRAAESVVKRLIEAQRVASIGDWDYDIATGQITWSAQVFQILGRSPSLGPPQSYQEHAAIYDPPSQLVMESKIALAIASASPQEYELRMVRPDGKPVYVQAVAVPQVDSRGAVVGLHGTIQDISARRAAEAALQASELRYRSLFESMSSGYAYCQGFFEQDELTDFIFLETNGAFKAITGMINAKGMKVSALLPTARESSRSLFALYGRVALSGRSERAEEYVPSLDVWLAISVYSPAHAHFVVVFDNITERKQAEMALRESDLAQKLLVSQLDKERSRLIAAQRVAKIGSWETSLGTNSVVWSDEVHHIFETDHATFPATHEAFLEMIHPEDRRKVEEAFSLSLTPSIGAGIVKHRVLLADARTKYLEERWRVIFDERNMPLRVIGTCQDITERVEIDEALQKQNTELRVLLDLLPAMIWFKDTQDRILRANKRAAEDAGRSVSEVEGKTGLEIYPQTGAALFANDLEVIRSGRPSLGVVTLSIGPDGAERWIHTDKIPFYDTHNNCIGVIAAARDITESKLAEIALRESEGKFRQLAESINDAFWIRSPDMMEVDYVSPAFEQIWGRSVESLYADPHKWRDFVLAEDRARVLESFKLLTDGAPKLEIEYRIVRPDGEIRWVRVRGFPIRNSAGVSVRFAGIVSDITELKKVLHDLLELNESLEQRVVERTAQIELANRAKSTFLATMSHEIRTPLNGVIGMLELLSLTRLDEKQRASIDIVRQSGHALASIIDDILDHSKIEAGKLSIQNEVASVQTIMAAVVSLFSGVASSKSLALTVAIDERISPVVWVDPLRLQQILNNFVSNAVKFTAKGYVEIRAELLEQTAGTEVVCFTVIDTGIGVSTEDQIRLFQPFTQIEALSTRRYGGTGLGLSICRQLTEMMGGSIDMESTPGAGTAMHLILALRVADPKLLPNIVQRALADLTPVTLNRRAAPGVEQAVAEGTLVLVVDDHRVNRMVLTHQISALGYAVETAEDGLDGIGKWRSGRYGLVLADCQMPVMDGYDMVRQMRSLESSAGAKRTPVIACTANAMAADAQRCYDAGMDDYLTKPLELRDLALKLNHWLPLPDTAPPATTSEPVPPPLPESAVPVDAADAAMPADAVDAAVLSALSRANPATQRELVGLFRQINDQDAIELRKLVAARDGTATRRMAHRIKGATRMLGAFALAALADQIETAARADDWHVIGNLMPRFEAELVRVNAFLGALQNN